MNKYMNAAASALFLLSTPALAAKKQALTPMELQAIQSKEFETTKETLFASCMSVFQDIGYTIDSADVQSGFITAQSPTVNKTNFGNTLFGQAASGNTKGTAFIEQMSNGRSRIRLNFVISKSMSSAYGQNSKLDKPILDPKPYLVAWDKIDEALFVRGAMTKALPVPASAVGQSASAAAIGRSPPTPEALKAAGDAPGAPH